VLPSFTIRRASTTVQLRDGQSFAIAGLIKSDNGTSIRRFPILGEIPILGALFRSSEFKNDKTELLFVITPRLVKPLPPNYALPTDNYVPPSKKEFFIDGKLEGKPAASEAGNAKQPPVDTAPAPQPDNSGFEMK
jgi:pilus assembly protein CpaC